MGVEWSGHQGSRQVWGSPSSGQYRPGSEWEELFGIFAVVVAGTVAVVLATGHLSALVFDGSWPVYRLVDVPAVLGAVVSDPGDPGRAWDGVNTGGAPPGPVGFWGTALAMAVLGVWVWFRSKRPPKPQRDDGDEGIRWASRWQSRTVRVRSVRTSRLVVGRTRRHGGSVIAVEPRHSLLVFGATQSGKTTGLAVPAILEWPGPVLATSTKGDLVDDTVGWRSRLGRVQVFDPSDVTSYPGSPWSPMTGSETWEGAQAAAHELANAGKAAAGQGVRMAELWYGGARKLLAPYLYAAARTGRTISDVARWIDAEDHDEVLAIIADHRDAALAHEATFKKAADSRSGLFQVCQQMLSVYLDPVVARSAETSDIVASDLLDGGAHTLYITAPNQDQERFQTVFSTLVRQVVDAVYTHTGRTGRPLDPPMLLVLDEAANIAPIHKLDQVASTAAALGLQMVTVFQDVAQLRDRYDTAADTVINNHKGVLLLPGNKDTNTLTLVSSLAGDHTIDRPSVTVTADNSESATNAAEWRPLLAPAEARTIKAGSAILIYGNLPPIRLWLRPWHRNRRLKRRSRTSPPPTSGASPPTAADTPPPPVPAPLDDEGDRRPGGGSRARNARARVTQSGRAGRTGPATPGTVPDMYPAPAERSPSPADVAGENQPVANVIDLARRQRRARMARPDAKGPQL